MASYCRQRRTDLALALAVDTSDLAVQGTEPFALSRILVPVVGSHSVAGIAVETLVPVDIAAVDKLVAAVVDNIQLVVDTLAVAVADRIAVCWE
jgi:hypothetical protein